MAARLSAPEEMGLEAREVAPPRAPAASLVRQSPGATAAVLLGVFYLGVLLYHSGLSLAYPYDLDYGEGYVLNDSLRLLRGETIYKDVDSYPMVRSPYPPLFLVAYAGLLAVTGPSFLPGRSLALLATLATAGLISLGAWHLTRRRGLAALAGLLFLSSPYVYQWAPLARVDTLALVLTVAGLVVAIRFGPGGAVASAILCALGLMARQTVVAAPAAIFLHLLWSHRRAAFTFAAVLAAIVSTVTLALVWATGGQYIHHVLLGSATNPFKVSRVVLWEHEFLALHGLTLLLGAAWALSELVKGRRPLVALYLVMAGLSTVAVGSSGSNLNYFLEAIAASSLAIAPMLDHIERMARPMVRRAVWLLVVEQLVVMFHLPNVWVGWPPCCPPHGFTPTARDWEVGRRLDEWIASAEGPVLAEPAGFAVRAGREVLTEPYALYGLLQTGRWDPGILTGDIVRRCFSLILLRQGAFPEPVMVAIAENYQVAEVLPSSSTLLEYTVLVPRTASTGLREESCCRVRDRRQESIACSAPDGQRWRWP